MAQNLVMFDPAGNEWFVVCRIGSLGDIQIFQYSYAKDEMDILKLLLLDGIDIAIKYMVG